MLALIILANSSMGASTRLDGAIRDASSASFRIRNSWSSRVKMSFVTAAIVSAPLVLKAQG